MIVPKTTPLSAFLMVLQFGNQMVMTEEKAKETYFNFLYQILSLRRQDLMDQVHAAEAQREKFLDDDYLPGITLVHKRIQDLKARLRELEVEFEQEVRDAPKAIADLYESHRKFTGEC